MPFHPHFLRKIQLIKIEQLSQQKQSPNKNLDSHFSPILCLGQPLPMMK